MDETDEIKSTAPAGLVERDVRVEGHHFLEAWEIESRLRQAVENPPDWYLQGMEQLEEMKRSRTAVIHTAVAHYQATIGRRPSTLFDVPLYFLRQFLRKMQNAIDWMVRKV